MTKATPRPPLQRRFPVPLAARGTEPQVPLGAQAKRPVPLAAQVEGKVRVVVADGGVAKLVPRHQEIVPPHRGALSRQRTKTVRLYFAVSTTQKADALKGESAYLGTRGNGLPMLPRPLEKGGRRGTEKGLDHARAQ